MEEYIANTIKAYDDVKTYEDSTSLLVPEAELNKLADMLKADSLILDAGCAFGRDTRYLLAKGLRVEGIDLSPSLIKRAHELLPGVTFNVKDVRNTGYDDNSVDGIWCNATLLHLKDADIDKALREFHRILKPGGILAVTLKKGSGTKKFVEKFSSSSERFFNFKTRETFLEHLQQAKFKEVESYYFNERERYGSEKRDLDWLTSFSIKE